MVEWDDGKKYRQFHLLHHHHHSRGREGRKRKQIEKKWEKEDKTKENSRTLKRLTLTTSSETPDVLSGFASLMVASSPMMILGVIIDVDYSNSEVNTRVSRVSF